jgi:hypothetical protein
MKWAAVYDTDGNGEPDLLKAVIERRDLGDLKNGNYTWTWGSIANQTITNAMINSGTDKDTLLVNVKSSDGAAINGMLNLKFGYTDPFDNKQYQFDSSITIIDSCGPAILNNSTAKIKPASENEPYEQDTLFVNFTEEIVRGDVVFYFSSADNKSSINSSNTDSFLFDGIYSESNTDFVFLFDAGKLTDSKIVKKYNFIKIVHSDGIEDMAGNKPLENNQWVELNFDATPDGFPEFDFAEIWDTYGKQNGRLDGKGDSIFVKLSLKEESPKRYDYDNIVSVMVALEGDAPKTFQKNEINRLSDDSFRISYNEFTSGKGGNITIYFDDGNLLTGKIYDKVAPVITWASYKRYDDRPDTLKVKFSEYIDVARNSQINVFPSKAYSLNWIRNDGNDGATYVVTNGNFNYGDEIWIKANSGLKDRNGNEQTKDENERVKIEYLRHISLNVNSAAYFDTDNAADGYIDLIKVKFGFSDCNTGVNCLEYQYAGEIEKIVKSGFNLPKGGSRNLSLKSVNLPEQDIIDIWVSEDRSYAAKTSVDRSIDRITINNYEHIVENYDRDVGDTLVILASGAIEIEDKLAPVILNGRFVQMIIQNDDDEIIDTLVITFSERVSGQITSDMINAKSANGMLYDIYFEPVYGSDNRVIIPVKYDNGKNNNLSPEIGDSIRIRSGISDGKNIQGETVFAELIFQAATANYNIIIYPTPYNPKNPLIEEGAKAKYGLNGKDLAIIARPHGNRSFSGTGNVMILDQLGNKIISSEFVYKNGGLIWQWNGRNKNGRIVGAGPYQAIIQIRNDATGDSQTILRKVGIAN